MIKNLKSIKLSSDIHLWHGEFPLQDEQWHDTWEILDINEKKRAEGYIFPEDRQRFILRRGLLRLLIGFYTGMEPGLIEFCTNQFGKSRLANSSPQQTLHFNVSHSCEKVVYAFSFTTDIGVDIEKINPAYPWESIAPHCCTEEELRRIRSCAAHRQRQAFFSLWTRKEAYLKATAQGLSALEETKQLNLFGFPHHQFITFNLGDDYVGTVCRNGDNLGFGDEI
jgi:4'-phosphopantetheinyl transferase